MFARLTMAITTALTPCRRDARPIRLHGLVVDVQAASFLQIASFTLRTDDGQIVEMVVEGDVGFTPSHLRDHMALGDPVTVSVRYADGLTIATSVEDRQAE
jgi:hypothetical protein